VLAILPLTVLLPLALLLLVLPIFLAACGGSGSSDLTGAEGPETTSPVAAVAPSSTSSTVPDVGLSEDSHRYMEELKVTVRAAARLGEELEASGAQPDDPRSAIVFGVRARGQAITTLKALSEKDMEMADAAALEMRSLLARANNLGKSSTPDAVKEAAVHVEKLGIPSADPEKARPVLEQMVKDLKPLLDVKIGSG